MVRVPDQLSWSVAFLLVATESGHQYGGTAFFVRVPGDEAGIEWAYLVTAKHNIERAFRTHDSLAVRYNTKSGSHGYILPPIDRWITSDDEGVDIAAVHFPVDAESDLFLVPLKWAATPEIRQEKHIGVGDELFIPGLFWHRHGYNRNLPIVRRGIIACMDQEPLQDQYSGLEYRVFLAEVHSFGGLSGSPVFARLTPGRAYGAESTEFYLLGIIRGHWDAKSPITSEFPQSEADGLNMGIAIVTPIEELVALLLSADEMGKRRKSEFRWKKHLLEERQ